MGIGKTVPICVIVCVYNAEEYIAECIESVIKQMDKEDEFIIVNDGSADNTYQIIKNFSKYRNIKVINNSNNKGLAYSRNIGVENSENDILFFIDADTILPENMLHKLKNLYTKFNDVQGITGKGIETNIKTRYDLFRKKFLEQNQGNTIKYNPDYFSGLCMSVKKNVFNKIDFDVELKGFAEDVDLAYKFKNHDFSFIYHPELYVYHKRTDNLKSLYNMVYNHIFWSLYVHKKNNNSQHKKYFFAGFKILFKQIIYSIYRCYYEFILLALLIFYVRIKAVIKSQI